MDQKQQLNFEVYLYQYSKSPFDIIASPDELKTGLPVIKDQEDLRLTTENFEAAVTSSELSAAADQIDVLKSGAPDPLRSALKDNFVVQLEQQKENKFNWLNLSKKGFWSNFYAKVKTDKTLLTKVINTLVNSTTINKTSDIYVRQICLTDDNFSPPVDAGVNCVLSVDDFRTHVESVDSGMVLTLDAKKLSDKNITIVENDVLEFVIDYPLSNNKTPVFYGFVVNVTSVERYGEILEYKITCAGLGKYLYLSRVIKDNAIVTQFEQGAEISDITLTPFENLFNNKNVLEVFDYIMTNALQLTSNYKEFSQHALVYPGLIASISLLTNLISDLTDLSKGGVKSMHYMPYTKTHEAAVKNARDNGLLMKYTDDSGTHVTALADVLENAYKLYPEISNYLTVITLDRDDMQAYKEDVDSGKATLPGGKIPYQLLYDFKFDTLAASTAGKEYQSFQFSIFLLILYYRARKQSLYSNVLIGVQNPSDPRTVADSIATFQTAAEEQYKVYNVMIRSAWNTFYSTVNTPIELLNDIRTKSFYEIFESRPGIIVCRPPRYNVWYEGTDFIIDEDLIIDFNKIRNDAQLVSRADYKFTFPNFGTQPYVSGHWTDFDTLYKYGLRAEGPKDNPNVLTDTFGHFWAAMDLIRSNSGTRKVTISVPANKEYVLGALYFLPNKGIPQELIDINDGITRGIVGYVSSISTNIAAGQLSTHSLELSYIRQAELVTIKNSDGSTQSKLNFYRIPDLETFMQYIEKIKSDNPPTDMVSNLPTNQTLVDASDKALFDNTNNPEAILINDIFYAVSADVYGAVKDIATKVSRADKQNSYTTFSEEIIRHGLSQCVSATSFTKKQFASKSNPDSVPYVTQELINRLWAIDLCLRKAPTQPGPVLLHEVKFNTNTPAIQRDIPEDQKLTVYLDSTDQGTFEKVREQKESYNLKKSQAIKVLSKPEVQYAIPAGIDCHNTEYPDFLSVGNDVKQSDLRAWLDFYLLGPGRDSNNNALQHKIFSFSTLDGSITAQYYASELTNIPTASDAPYRWYHTAENVGSTETAYTNKIFAGLNSIPDLDKFQIATCANTGCFVGHKDMSEVKESVKDAHRYGLEADVMPYFLQYWNLQDLIDTLTLALHRDVSALFSNRIADYLTADDLATFIHIPLDFTGILKKLQGWLSTFDMIYTANVPPPINGVVLPTDRSKVTVTYPTMLGSSVSDTSHYVSGNYQYKIDEYVDTYHLRVKHTFNNQTHKASIPRALNFRIRYYNTNFDGIKGNPPQDPDAFYKLMADNIKDSNAGQVFISSIVGVLGLTGGIELGAALVTPIGWVLGVAAAAGISAYLLTSAAISAYNKATTRAGKDAKIPQQSIDFFFTKAEGV